MAAISEAIRATRGSLRNKASAISWAATAPEASALCNRNLVYYNGAFSPPTTAHAHIVATINANPTVDALWMDPEPSRPGKPQWLNETLEARVEMCEQLLSDHGSLNAGVGTLRRDLGPDQGSSIELFHTLRALLGGPGHGKILWAFGADVLDNMRYWKDKAREFLKPGEACDGFMVFARETWTEEQLLATAAVVLGREPAPGEITVLPMPEHVAAASSHKVRKALVSGVIDGMSKEVSSKELLELLHPAIWDICKRPEVLEVYSDQVENTPDATPQNKPQEDPVVFSEEFKID
jgi:nicotinic acid mononucleotide adenylyltransferase